MTPGQTQGLLGQLGQLRLLNGIGRALNPLGLPIGGLQNRMANRGNNGQFNQQNPSVNQYDQQNQNPGQNFGFPKNQQLPRSINFNFISKIPSCIFPF